MRNPKFFALNAVKLAIPLFLTAPFSQAAILLDGSAGASAASGSALTWSHTVTTGASSILMVAFSYEDTSATVGPIPGSITFGTQDFTQLVSANASTGAGENVVSIWYLMNPTAGTATITIAGVTLDTVTNLVRGSSASFSGVTAAPTLFATDINIDNTAPSLGFTGVASGSALYTAIAFSGSGTSIGTTSPLLTVPPGGSFTGGQAAHHTAYNLNVGGSFSVSSDSANARSVLGAVILVPEPSSMLLGAIGALGLLRRRRGSC